MHEGQCGHTAICIHLVFGGDYIMYACVDETVVSSVIAAVHAGRQHAAADSAAGQRNMRYTRGISISVRPAAVVGFLCSHR
jgi:hypothetical protein